MSCKDFWEKEMAGRLAGPARVAAGQVDGAEHCVVPGCPQLVNRATGRCVGGHVQYRRQTPDQARALVEALACCTRERRAVRGAGTPAIDSPADACLRFATYAAAHEQPGWKRAAVQAMLGRAEDELRRGLAISDARIQAARAFLAVPLPARAPGAGPDWADYQMAQVQAAMSDPAYQQLVGGAEQVMLYWAARATYDPPGGLYLTARRGNRLHSARYEEGQGWQLGEPVEHPAAGEYMAQQARTARRNGLLLAEHCPGCGQFVSSDRGHACPGKLDACGRDVRPFARLLGEIMEPLEQTEWPEEYGVDGEQLVAAKHDLEAALRGEEPPGLPASLRFVYTAVLEQSAEVHERLLRDADAEDFIHFDALTDEVYGAVGKYVAAVTAPPPSLNADPAVVLPPWSPPETPAEAALVIGNMLEAITGRPWQVEATETGVRLGTEVVPRTRAAAKDRKLLAVLTEVPRILLGKIELRQEDWLRVAYRLRGIVAGQALLRSPWVVTQIPAARQILRQRRAYEHDFEIAARNLAVHVAEQVRGAGNAEQLLANCRANTLADAPNAPGDWQSVYEVLYGYATAQQLAGTAPAPEDVVRQAQVNVAAGVIPQVGPTILRSLTTFPERGGPGAELVVMEDLINPADGAEDKNWPVHTFRLETDGRIEHTVRWATYAQAHALVDEARGVAESLGVEGLLHCFSCGLPYRTLTTCMCGEKRSRQRHWPEGWPRHQPLKPQPA